MPRQARYWEIILGGFNMSLLKNISKVIKWLFICLPVALISINFHSPSFGQVSGSFPPSEVHFEKGINFCSLPFRIIDNNMFITIKINDSVEVEVAFDSGFPLNGIIIIDSVISNKLGLQYAGSVPLGGAGDESLLADIAGGATISLPGVSFKNQQVLVVRKTQRYEKWLASGIIGGTFLNTCVVEIDHEKSIINIYESNSFKTQTAGKAFDIAFSQGIPIMDAFVKQQGNPPKKIKMLVDTGADVPFSLYSNGGLEFMPPPESPFSYISEGIKGDIHGHWARINAISFDSITMDNCIVAYPTRGFDDVVATLGQNGFFGLDAQRRFTITFDYPHSRIFLKPNSHFNVPFEFNMAGLVLRTLPDSSVEVIDVLPNSPGSKAGIKKGDLIVALNGRNTSSISYIEREQLFTRNNQLIQISINRDGHIIDFKLTLRRII